MLSNLYNRLTQPFHTLEPDRQRQAQLLASLIIFIFILMWAIEIFSIITYSAEGDYYGFWITIGVSFYLAGVYYLGRTRHTEPAVWLLIISLSALVWFFSFYTDGQIYPQMLYFFIVPFLLGSFFLSEAVTLRLFAALSLFLLLLVIIVKDPALREALTGPLVQFVAIGGLTLVLKHHRDRMEEDRRQELDRERNMLRTVIDNVPDQIFVRDRSSRFLLGNLADARVMGVSDPANLVGKTDFDFYPPELAARYQADNQAVMDAGVPIINKEEPSIGVEGAERIILTTKVPLRDLNGEIIGLVGIARDITSFKQAEKEHLVLEKQLAQTHKLEALGQLAAGIAHEINTPIQYVGGNLRFLRGQLPAFEAAQARVNALRGFIAGCWRCSAVLPQMDAIIPNSKVEYMLREFPLAIDQSLEGIDQVAHIIRAMRTFSHPGNDRRIAVNINHILDNMLTITHNQWKNLAEVETHLDASLPAIPCFPPELSQAFLNIILNAIDAIDEARMAASARAAAPDRSAAPNEPHAADFKGKITVSSSQREGCVEVRISDTGCGIPAAIQDKIFDYFFTTKDVDKGSGQGLAICHNIIVKMHGGSIAVESREGAGTTFIIQLPFTETLTEVPSE